MVSCSYSSNDPVRMRMHDAEIKLLYALGLGSASRVHGLSMYTDIGPWCVIVYHHRVHCATASVEIRCVCVHVHFNTNNSIL